MFPTDKNFESEFTFERSANPLADELPFYVLLLGDWSGDSEKQELKQRRPIEIDRDNFDEVLSKLHVRLDLAWETSEADKINLQFASLDDFHPDNLFQQVTLFSELRDIRRRLSNSDTFNSAVREIRAWFSSPENLDKDSEIEANLNDAPPVDSNNLLDMILTDQHQSVLPKAQTVDDTELGRLVSQIVAPHLIRIDESEQSALISMVDQTISQLMREILHHRKFQDLEAAWRALYFLLRRVETNSKLKFFILDISKNELVESLKSVDDLSDSFLYQLLIAQSSENNNASPFSVLTGNFDFGLNVEDVAFLMRAGKIAAAINAPFISYIKPQMLGLQSFSEENDLGFPSSVTDSTAAKLWLALRSAPEANFIGLSPAKVTARMPYGSSFDSTENFSFEEITPEIREFNVLRFNPSFIIVLLLAQSFLQNEWQMEHNLQNEVEKLPSFFIRQNGEAQSVPVAEIVFTEKLLEEVLNQGLTPLVSPRDSDKIRVWRLQSISVSFPELAGKWNL
jgi:type VI secretion system protein ImpC